MHTEEMSPQGFLGPTNLGNHAFSTGGKSYLTPHRDKKGLYIRADSHKGTELNSLVDQIGFWRGRDGFEGR